MDRVYLIPAGSWRPSSKNILPHELPLKAHQERYNIMRKWKGWGRYRLQVAILLYLLPLVADPLTCKWPFGTYDRIRQQKDSHIFFNWVKIYFKGMWKKERETRSRHNLEINITCCCPEWDRWIPSSMNTKLTAPDCQLTPFFFASLWGSLCHRISWV